jgi:hypothetical protein
MSTQSPAGSLPEGYAVSTVDYEGTTYELTYYRGFVGKARIQPLGAGGPTLDFPLEPGTYVVPQPTPPVSPLGGPDAQCHVKLKGGPNRRAVKFHVDNSPNGHAHGYKGPVASFTAIFNAPGNGATPGAAADNAAGVVVSEGAAQVKSVTVQMASGGVPFQGIAGAARAFDGPGGTPVTGGGSGDETLIVDDNATVCPPTC